MKSISSRLTQLMAENGVNSAELARKTGIGQPVVYRLMTGMTENPQLLTIKPLADYFGVTIDQLAGLSPLGEKKISDNLTMHTINNKLTTIKTIASVLGDLLPQLIEGYKKAVSAHLITEEISSDVMPLLPVNNANLIKAINQLQDLLIANNTSS